MIIHHKKINNIELGLKKTLKYSENYKFIPLKFYYENTFTDCIFQTPKLFTPFGIQKIDENKKIIDLSFQNKENDKDVQLFIQNLTKIYKTIVHKYKNYNVNFFLKETIHDLSMRLKVNNSIFFDSYKNEIKKINSFSHGEFIIQLKGLWICDDNIWFQWYLLQGKMDTNITLEKYCFIEEENDKYQKMLQMGVPKEAIELKRKMDSKVPPPPPLPNFKPSLPVSKIKASDLLNVKLKKPKEILKQRIVKNSSNHFEPPSLEELQITISKLKKSNS